jgi:hypothetical protein
MSTKTTFKRIALVAVAALGFGVLTSVAPASAAQITSSAITAGTVAPTRVGVATAVNVTLTHADVVEGTDTFTVTATLVSKPTGSTGTVLNLATGTATETSTRKNGTLSGNSASATVSTGRLVIGAGTGVLSSVFGVALTPDVAGTYTVLVSEGNATYTAGNRNTTITFTTAGAPASIELSTVNSVIATNGANGSPLKIVLKDAAGVVTKPNATESIKLAATTGSATLSSANLGSAAFVTGLAMVNVRDAVASDSVVITATGDGLIPSTVTSSISFTSSSNASLNTAAGTATWQQGTGVATTGFLLGAVSGSAQSLKVSSTATSQSFGLKTLTANGASTDTTAATTKHATLVITDTTGAITGVPGTVFDRVVSQGPAGATISSAATITATLGTTGSYTVTNALNAATLTVSGETPAATTVGAISPANITAALASTNTFTAQVTDQFGLAFAGAAVVASVSAGGRNVAQAAKNLVSDASGYVSYTLTDSGTTGTTDTISFAGATTVTRTLTYAAITVGTIALNGGNTTAGVADATKTVREINAGDGVESTTYPVAATVKDASGNLVAGVPVTFSVSGTGAAITSTTLTGYTSSTGVATAQVYGWIAGDYTVTAKAGAVTATGTITFGHNVKGDERVVSASVSGPIVTAKTVDRFGNPVPGVTIYATKTGVGYFGAGVTSTSAVTNAAGIAEFVIAGGSADVTVSTIDPSAAAGTYGSGQTSAPKGYLFNSRTAAGLALNAFTATTAGTALKNEAGVGASFDAAGVASVTVSVDIPDTASAAADAAAEATDAANAATDAANAAAEAADAATAAAQDAADAVAALSTQVSEMVNALKKQITALTNLVIKIQKKVRA